eukprot:9492478-Pyramimonas_sp.AAC.1
MPELLADIRDCLARASAPEPCWGPLDPVRPGEPAWLATLEGDLGPARGSRLKPRAAQVPVLSFGALLALESLPPARARQV